MAVLSDGIKKLFLAGVGAVATSAEKSQDILDELVKKGELTVQQGKELNEELKHNVKKTFQKTEDDMDAYLKGLSAEQLEALKAKLNAEDIVEEAEVTDAE